MSLKRCCCVFAMKKVGLGEIEGNRRSEERQLSQNRENATGGGSCFLAVVSPCSWTSGSSRN
jgi:hypothetical protein